MTPTPDQIAALERRATALLAALDKHEDASDRACTDHYRPEAEDDIYNAKAALRDLLPKERTC